MSHHHEHSGPASLLLAHAHLFTSRAFTGTVLDLACGDGRNGLFLAQKGISVVLADRSDDALQQARKAAGEREVDVDILRVDLEKGGGNPLGRSTYGGIIVFRYLHRPLIPCIKTALTDGGVLIYETYTIEQPSFGKPRNPDFLLNPGELKDWFKDWDLIHYFEGIKRDPDRAVAQIVCQKPLKP